jgi:hypothetical protein
MELKINSWWNSLNEKDKELFIKYLYENSEDLGFYFDENKQRYKLR